MTTHTWGTILDLKANASHGQPMYKIWSLSLSHSRDILGGLKI